jgi:ATP-binding cassette, subfamily B (MDR/TAP), member 1
MSPGSFSDTAITSQEKPANFKKLAKKIHFFSRRKRQEQKNDDEKGSTDDGASEIEAPVLKNLGPVGYTELFRYVQLDCLFAMSADYSSCSFATRFEVMLDFIGIIAAVGSGAAQVFFIIIIGCLLV